jgi:hypothetical protein
MVVLSGRRVKFRTAAAAFVNAIFIERRKLHAMGLRGFFVVNAYSVEQHPTGQASVSSACRAPNTLTCLPSSETKGPGGSARESARTRASYILATASGRGATAHLAWRGRALRHHALHRANERRYQRTHEQMSRYVVLAPQGAHWPMM